jgi:DsbC/DsbD-like thiol-disulfide interchange protein
MRTRLSNMMLRSVLLAPCALHLAGAWADAPQAPADSAQHLTAQLVIPPAQIYPGESFTAGLYFKLEPGWHVYWSNAGDSGEPPRIKWTLPPGISAGALEFPAPRRLPLGHLVDYGYEDEVLFPIRFEVAPSFSPGAGPASLGAEVFWLVCREICIPGRATLSASRPVAAAAAGPGGDGADAQLVARFESALPQPLPAPGYATFSRGSGGFVLVVATGQRERGAQFFPLDQNLIANAAPQRARPLDNGIQLQLVQDENLAARPQLLRGVVEFPDGRAYAIRATATPAAAPAGRAALWKAVALAVLLLVLAGVALRLVLNRRRQNPGV